MDKIQGFQKGLNSDLSPVYQQEGSYVDAINIECIDDELQGSVAISNSKGNKFQIDIPNIGAIYRISIKTGVSGNTLITINGITNPVPFDSTGKTTKDLYDYIIAYAPYGEGTLFNIFFSTTTIVFYPIPPNTITISLNVTTFLTDPNPAFIPANTNLRVIGYGIIRDDIYLFTTPSDDQDPKVNGGGYGYIWKLTYDNITFDAIDATITLIYANDLNFSTFWNIPQTGVVGRYENAGIQRLYWTDNYNKLRSINVVDPQLGAVDLSLIDVESAVDFDIPLLKSLTGAPGTTLFNIGCYQLAYRLSNTGGSTTGFSVPSNPVFLVRGEEEKQTAGTNWKDYYGEVKGTKTNKRIVWTINSVDQDYDRIEAVIIIREDKEAVPTIKRVFEGPVISETMDIIVDGDILISPDSVDVTLDEFLALSTTFTNIKTIGTKDNRLIVGNVNNGGSNGGNSSSELTYDARAFRAKTISSDNIILTNNGVSSTFTSTTARALNETEDTINDYSTPANACFYKPNTTILGGSGTNISYEFYSIAVAMDKAIQPIDGAPAPFVSTNPDNTITKLNLNVFTTMEDSSQRLQEYPITFPNPINDGMKFPQMNSIYWGYQNNEIYRFGIQFYDKSKQPYFVKWIGDIKMPDYFDACVGANNVYEDGSLTGFTDFRKSFVAGHGSNTAFSTQLGINFTVNIPIDLTDNIEGYSIVRVKRGETDKTVIAEGIISNTFIEYGVDAYDVNSENMDYVFPSSNFDRLSFLTPNILDATLTAPAANMKLRTSSYLSAANTNVQSGPGAADYWMFKLFNHVQLAAAFTFETNIDVTFLMQGDGPFTDGADTLLASPLISGTVLGPISIAADSYYLNTLNGIDGIPQVASGALDTARGKLFVYIYNATINQYGGNTYTSRSDNEYILCSHFRSTKTNVSGYIDTFRIYGGDVTNSSMDEQRLAKNWSIAGRSSTTFFYPASSPVNRELRYGKHVNYSLIADTNTVDNYLTDYFYNNVYSCENNIVKFFIKPDPFMNNGIFDNRFYISEVKINGELTDSWSVFKPNNYWDVEGVYGPINSMLPLADKMYFWQDRAFGVIEVNPRAMVTDVNSSTNSQIQVGTGLPLQRHDYISIITGTKHQGSTLSSSSKLYWYDTNLFKLMIFSRSEGVTPVSDVKGLFAYLSKNLKTEIQNFDKPTYSFIGTDPIGINGVVATYDNKKHRAIYTFHSGENKTVSTFNQTSFTVCLNELKDSFTTFYSFTPRIYINDNKYIISTDNTPSNKLHKLYLHDVGNYGEFYTVKYDSYIKFIVNPNPQVNKVFDNFVYDSQATIFDPATKRYINFNDDTWSKIRVTNDYQNTDIYTITPNTTIMRKERSWQMQLPRNRVLYSTSNSPDIYANLSPVNKSFAERIRDKYIQVELWYNNLTNRELKTNSFTTIFRKSDR